MSRCVVRREQNQQSTSPSPARSPPRPASEGHAPRSAVRGKRLSGSPERPRQSTQSSGPLAVRQSQIQCNYVGTALLDRGEPRGEVVFHRISPGCPLSCTRSLKSRASPELSSIKRICKASVPTPLCLLHNKSTAPDSNNGISRGAPFLTPKRIGRPVSQTCRSTRYFSYSRACGPLRERHRPSPNTSKPQALTCTRFASFGVILYLVVPMQTLGASCSLTSERPRGVDRGAGVPEANTAPCSLLTPVSKPFFRSDVLPVESFNAN